jgi:hypothetical protein|tara:strand:+ start:728 stop:1240 length:513 start_codon:yes stop_codon:yes gene_type:complete
MEVVDDCLSQEDFNTIRNHLYGDDMWAFSDGIDYKDDEDKFQFYHYYIKQNIQVSKHLNILLPIVNKINPFVFTRIKANFLTRTSTIIENRFHVDIDMSQDKLYQWTTSILYMNTNNGYTEFQDGRIAMENTTVKSVANRMVTFPANLRHRGTSCTDQNSRVVINFNYYL